MKRKPVRRVRRYQDGGEVVGGVEKVNMDQPEIMQGPQPQIYQPSSSSESNMISSGISTALKLGGLSSSSKRKGGKVTKVVRPVRSKRR